MIFAIEMDGKDPRNMCAARDKIDCIDCGQEASGTCIYAQMFALREITTDGGNDDTVFRTRDGKKTYVKRLFGQL